jgi:hypothetical protein
MPIIITVGLGLGGAPIPSLSLHIGHLVRSTGTVGSVIVYCSLKYHKSKVVGTSDVRDRDFGADRDPDGTGPKIPKSGSNGKGLVECSLSSLLRGCNLFMRIAVTKGLGLQVKFLKLHTWATVQEDA